MFEYAVSSIAQHMPSVESAAQSAVLVGAKSIESSDAHAHSVVIVK